MAAQQLTIFFSEKYPEIQYSFKELGQIALHKISEDLTVLKIYFTGLQLQDTGNDVFGSVDQSIEVMLTNYPVNYATLEELDGQVVTIKHGWTNHETFTMLSILDGEPIGHSTISFKKVEKDIFEIVWNGIWGEENNEQNMLALCLRAQKRDVVVTPLCMHDQELLEMHENEVTHPGQKMVKKNWMKRLMPL